MRVSHEGLDGPYDNNDRPRRTQPWLLIVLAAVVLAAALVFVLTRKHTTAKPAPTTPTVTNKVGTSKVTTASSTSVGTADDDITWKQYPGLGWLPYSRAAGPSVESAGLASGFAHNELGSVFAAIHISNRSGAGRGPDVFRPTIQQQVVGPEAVTYLRNVEGDYAAARQKYGLAEGSPIPSPETGTLLAYKANMLSPDLAEVQYVISPAPDSTRFFNITVSVQWIVDDWRLVAPSSSSSSFSAELPSIPASFVAIRKGS
jgi:hypothetical protein